MATGTVATNLASATAPMSRATINALVAKAVAADVAASKAPIVQAQHTYDAQALARQQQIAGFEKAAQTYLTSNADSAGVPYKDAANSIAEFAKGYGSNMSAFKQQAANQASQFATPEGQAEVQKAYGGTPSDVSYGVNGAIPASTLTLQGAAAMTNAKALPGIENARATDMMHQLAASANQGDQNFANQIAQLVAREPSLRNSYLNTYLTNEYRKAAVAAQAAMVPPKTAVDTANAAYTNAKDYTWKGPDGKTYNVPAGYVPEWVDGQFRLGKAATPGSGKTPYSQTYAGTFKAYSQKVNAAALNFAKGGLTTNPYLPNVKTQSRSYQQAYTYLWDSYGAPLLKLAKTPEQRQNVKNLIVEALDTAGFKAPPKPAKVPPSKVTTDANGGTTATSTGGYGTGAYTPGPKGP